MERDELQRALNKIGVEAYLDREGVDYRPSYGTNGLQLNLLECPACGGGGRKTYINAETGLGNCFHGSCGMKFNKFKLIRAVSGLSGHELDSHITAVAAEHGWMPKHERRVIVRGDLELPSKLHPVPIDGKNLQYLKERGISIETAAWFNLSYCHGGWWSYTTGEGEKKWVSYDKRIIIPIADLDGKLVSFQGRDTTGEQLPKYLFPVGFAVAGAHLYNGQNFVEGTHRHAVLNEGAFDVYAVHQALAGSASCAGMIPLGTFGMHLSAGPDGQIAKLLRLKERGLETITFMWDGEGAALSLAIKAGLTLLSLGFKVRIAQLPDGRDPNEVSAETVRQAIFRATLLTRLSAIRLATSAARMTA